MNNPFTPTAGYENYPVDLLVAEAALPETFNSRYRDLYNRLAYLKAVCDENSNYNSALLENLDTNIGEGVTGEDPTVYIDANILVNGESHLTSLLRLDAQAAGNAVTIAANAGSVAANLTTLNNVINKLDTAAGASGLFTWLSTNFIVAGERMKSVLEKFDQYLLGIRRSNELSYNLAFSAYVATLTGVYLSSCDTFYTTTALHPTRDISTDATISNVTQSASEANTYVVYKASSAEGETITHVTIDWDISTGGAIEVRFHANGESTWASMETYTTKGVKQTVNTTGINLVVAVKILTTTKLYSLRYVAV